MSPSWRRTCAPAWTPEIPERREREETPAQDLEIPRRLHMIFGETFTGDDHIVLSSGDGGGWIGNALMDLLLEFL